MGYGGRGVARQSPLIWTNADQNEPLLPMARYHAEGSHGTYGGGGSGSISGLSDDTGTTENQVIVSPKGGKGGDGVVIIRFHSETPDTAQ